MLAHRYFFAVRSPLCILSLVPPFCSPSVKLFRSAVHKSLPFIVLPSTLFLCIDYATPPAGCAIQHPGRSSTHSCGAERSEGCVRLHVLLHFSPRGHGRGLLPQTVKRRSNDPADASWASTTPRQLVSSFAACSAPSGLWAVTMNVASRLSWRAVDRSKAVRAG